jgi:hypothetical protein
MELKWDVVVLIFWRPENTFLCVICKNRKGRIKG